MKTWKKWLTAILATCCVSGMALGMTACGDDGDDGDGGGNEAVIQEVDYTIIVKDKDGNAIADAELTLMKGEQEIVVATTDADGKITGTVEEGAYVVHVASLPEGYLADEYIIDFVISASNNTLNVAVENVTPNGTQARPFVFIGDGDGYMSISVPANETHYYNVPRPMGRNLIVEGENFEVVYDGETLVPQEGKVEVSFNSEATDTYAIEMVGIVNKGAEENEIRLGMPVPAGSTAEKAIEVTLDTATTAETKSGKTVYYAWTATEDGELTVSSFTANATLILDNDNDYRHEEGTESVSMSVNAGDKILIQVGTSSDTTESVEITFILTFVQK